MPTNDINAAINFAVNICNNEQHGYSNGLTRSRLLDPDTDCSGLVYYSLQAGGFAVPDDIWYTGDMMGHLRTMGFTEYLYDKPHFNDYVPQHGDICVHREGTPSDGRGHAMFYAENVLGFADKYTPTRSTLPKAIVEALHDYNGQPGDSQFNGTGAYNELWAHTWNGLYGSYVWHVFRWGGTPPPPGPHPVDPDDAGIIGAIPLFTGWTQRRRKGRR